MELYRGDLVRKYQTQTFQRTRSRPFDSTLCISALFPSILAPKHAFPHPPAPLGLFSFSCRSPPSRSEEDTSTFFTRSCVGSVFFPYVINTRTGRSADADFASLYSPRTNLPLTDRALRRALVALLMPDCCWERMGTFNTSPCEGEGGEGDADVRAEDFSQSVVARSQGAASGENVVHEQDVMNGFGVV